jgi:hypothetical protein
MIFIFGAAMYRLRGSLSFATIIVLPACSGKGSPIRRGRPKNKPRMRKSKFLSRCALTVANIISTDSRKYRGGSAILHFHDKFLSR